MGFKVDIFDTGVLLQFGVFQITGHPVIFFPGPLTLDNEADTFGKREPIHIRLIELIGKGLGHPHELQHMEFINRLLVKHGTPPASDNTLCPGDSHGGSVYPGGKARINPGCPTCF